MSEQITRDEYHVWFDSTDEMLRELRPMVSRANEGRLEIDVYSRSSFSWLGCKNAETVERHFKQGWPELLNRLQPMAEQLRVALPLDEVTAVQIETRRRKRHRSDYGDTLDMHRVWSGDIDRAWERPIKERRLTPTERYASVFIDSGANAGTSADETLWRAATALVLVDVLTRMGINTEVWAGNSNANCYHHGPVQMWCGVRVKEYTQLLNEERLAVAAHVAMHRVYNFSMILAAPWTATVGLGRSVQNGLLKPLRDREQAGERVFRVGSFISSLPGALNEVRRVIDQLKPKRQEVA